jgi:LysR family nitrogen assimilation transcriptional regulator
VETGNITAAAEELNLAQPALGAQIRQLEDYLGVSLLVRHSRGVTPTPAGKLLYRHAERILDELEQAKREVRDFKVKEKNTLRLGVGPTMVMMMGPGFLTDAFHEIPEIMISLEEERSPVLQHALQQGQLDLAFLYNPLEDHNLIREALLEEDLLLVSAPKAGSPVDEIGFSDALNNNLAIGGERSGIRQLIEAEARRLSLEVRVAYEVHSVSSMKDMVARGAASTIMPYSLVAKEINDGALVGRRIVRPALVRTLYIVRQRVHSPLAVDQRVVALIDGLVRTYLGAISPWARSLR